ncbi:MAG: hypothetical protein ABIO06_07800 [Pseudolysinimonas sp.]
MKTLAMTTTSLLAAAALVLGGAVAANAATPAPTHAPATASTCSFGQHLVSAWLVVPKAMRDDLKAAKAEKPGPQRRSDLKAIATKALDGGYGAAVEDKAKWLQAHKGDAHIRPLPDNLKADLKTLHGESSKADKVKEANTIADKALAGDYGSKIESLAKELKASPAWQDCAKP